MNGQRQEPDDGRLPRPVPWERRGKVPLRDPITPKIISSKRDGVAEICLVIEDLEIQENKDSD